MNTVIFSIYDGGYRASALLLDDNSPLITEYNYHDIVMTPNDILYFEDEKLFNYFKDLFGTLIQAVIIIEDGRLFKVRYEAARYFGYDIIDGMFKPYVATEKRTLK